VGIFVLVFLLGLGNGRTTDARNFARDATTGWMSRTRPRAARRLRHRRRIVRESRLRRREETAASTDHWPGLTGANRFEHDGDQARRQGELLGQRGHADAIT
jgi:hypothetical protein